MLIDGAVGKFMTAVGRYGHVNTMVKNIKTKKRVCICKLFLFQIAAHLISTDTAEA